MPRAEGDGCVVGLGHILQAGAGGESAGGAVVRLEIVRDEEVSGVARRVEPAVGLDELLGLFGDEAPDGVSEDGFSLQGRCLERKFGGREAEGCLGEDEGEGKFLCELLGDKVPQGQGSLRCHCHGGVVIRAVMGRFLFCSVFLSFFPLFLLTVDSCDDKWNVCEFFC